jgi:hypothetical protein
MAKDLPQLKEYLDNKNVQWFIYNILKNESDKTSDGKINTGGYNQSAGNSSAFGAGQFIGSTRDEILKEYNIDAWSPDLEEQKLAIVALLDNVRQLDQIKKGDFSSQYDSKKGQWEAFHNKKGILDNKPNKWETEYTTLSETAVYRPDESWAKIPEDIKVEKLDLFENKYKGLPTEIVNPIDNVLDPTAEALGLPTSEDIIASLPAPPESELQSPTSAGTEELYSNFLEERKAFQENYTIGQLKELDSEKVYDQTIDDIEGMLNNLFMSDNYQVRGEDAPSTFSNGTQKRMDWLFQRVPNIERAIQPYGGEGERFKVDRKAIKDDIYTILDELGQITDEDSPLSYKDRIYEDPYKNQQPETGLSEDDFVDPRFLPAPPQQELQPPPQTNIDPELDSPFNANFLDDDYYAPRQRKEPTDIDPYLNEDLSGMEGIHNGGPSTAEEIDAAKALMEGREERTPSVPNTPVDYNAAFQKYKTEDPVKRNLLAKLKGQDYMGMLSDIGGYAARMAPLGQALRDSNSYDRVRYPSISPSLPTAYTQKRDVGTAFNTARQAAKEQGKLDLGALSALATQQAQTIAGVEENVANTRIGILNQAEQYNNQNAIRAMVDEAGNKGAAGTMKYQTLAAMSQMGQGSLREANMRRNDANVKAMFENVFGDEFGSYLKDKYSNA